MDLKVEPKPRKPRRLARERSLLRFYALALVDEARRFRQGFTRENIASFLRTLAWTIPLTVMIWVYAERQEVVLLPDVAMAIAVKSTESGKIATLDPQEKTIICNLKGPRTNLDRFQRLSPNAALTIDLDTKGLKLDEPNSIPTLQAIDDNPIFRNAGVTVDSCTPPSLLVRVDVKLSRSVPVAAPPGVQVDAQFKPDHVQVSGPSRVVRGLTSVMADIASLPELAQPGAHAPQTVSLIQDTADNLTYEPGEVQATLNVEEPDVRWILKNVPVWPFVSPDVESQYKITPANPTLPMVEVSGPPAQIDKLKEGRLEHPIYARLDVFLMESAANPQPATLQLENLPDGVHVLGANPQMSFTATAR